MCVCVCVYILASMECFRFFQWIYLYCFTLQYESCELWINAPFFFKGRYVDIEYDICVFIMIITFALKMQKVMFWSPYIYLFIYLYACYSHNSKHIKPNRMKFGGMIGFYPETIWLDFMIDRVKGQGQGHEKVIIFLNCMKFGGMIGNYSGTIWLDFGIDRVKGQGQGHEKVNIFFLP